MPELTPDNINLDFLARVASLRGKPNDTYTLALVAATASAATSVTGMVSRSTRQPPQLRIPRDSMRVPKGYWGRCSSGRMLVPRGERCIVFGRLVPESVDLTERLIGMTCDASFNVNVGYSDVAAPVSKSSFAAASVVYARTGPGLGTHIRVTSPAGGTLYYWVADADSM